MNFLLVDKLSIVLLSIWYLNHYTDYFRDKEPRTELISFFQCFGEQNHNLNPKKTLYFKHYNNNYYIST